MELQPVEVSKLALEEKEWVPDSSVISCTICNTSFSVFSRKHHCRRCGLVFCERCSAQKFQLQGLADLARVCDICYALLTENSTALIPLFSVVGKLLSSPLRHLQQFAVSAFQMALLQDEGRRAFCSGGHCARFIMLLSGCLHSDINTGALACLVNLLASEPGLFQASVNTVICWSSLFISMPIPDRLIVGIGEEYIHAVVSYDGVKPVLNFVLRGQRSEKEMAGAVLARLAEVAALHVRDLCGLDTIVDLLSSAIQNVRHAGAALLARIAASDSHARAQLFDQGTIAILSAAAAADCALVTNDLYATMRSLAVPEARFAHALLLCLSAEDVCHSVTNDDTALSALALLSVLCQDRQRTCAWLLTAKKSLMGVLKQIEQPACVPGVLTVAACLCFSPEGAQTVAAHFPFGLMETLSHNIHFVLPLAKFLSAALEAGLLSSVANSNGAAVLLSLLPKCMADPTDILAALRRFASDELACAQLRQSQALPLLQTIRDDCLSQDRVAVVVALEHVLNKLAAAAS